MSSSDIFDRKYAKLSELKAGDLIEVDDGFNCMDTHEVLRVHEDTHGLYVICKGDEDGGFVSEKHFLNGQIGATEDYLIGIYRHVCTCD